MKLTIYNSEKKDVGSMELPAQFSEEVRVDLIQKDVECLQANQRQRYGAKVGAGLRHSADVSRRRRKYRGSYGHGISRVPRKVLSRRGTRMNWVGSNAPGTRGGRRAHPPKADKVWEKKMNTKEKRKAIRSALAAVMHTELVQERGHALPEHYPFGIDTTFEKLSKTKEVLASLHKLGLTAELARAEQKTIRSGKGKNRGRKYRTKKGPLLVVSQSCELFKAAENIPGVEVTQVTSLNTEQLAPGCDVGRLTLFTQAALERLDKEHLFTNAYKGKQPEKEQKKESKKATKPKKYANPKPSPKKKVKQAKTPQEEAKSEEKENNETQE
jgi:large subunit ribosomal protein L4e